MSRFVSKSTLSCRGGQQSVDLNGTGKRDTLQAMFSLKRTYPRRGRFLATLVCGLLATLTILVLGSRTSLARPDKSVMAAASASASTLVAAEPTPPALPSSRSNAPRTVYVGLYLADISGFDLKEGRLKADLFLWCKWLGAKEPPSIALANGEIDKQDEVGREDEGDWHTIRWRVQGTFRGSFPLQYFPFDRQQIRLQIDLPQDEGVIVPDLAGSGMAKEFSITGWLYDPFFKAETFPTRYYSDFGSIEREGRPAEMTSVAFVLQLRKPFASYVIKVMLPLAIIILMAVLAFFVPAPELEVRAGICVTALLSCVAFHMAQSDALPEVSYLVTADKVFVGAYLLIISALALCVLNYNLHETRPQLVTWLDRGVYVLLPTLALVGGILSIKDVPDTAQLRHDDSAAVAGRERHATSKAELAVGLGGLVNLNTSGVLRALLGRGLAHQVSDTQQQPHLVQKLPSLTNEYVRFVADGGMLVFWRLRPSLQWGDGKPLTADDVAFTLELRPPDNRQGVRVVDPLTVEVSYRDRRHDNIEPFAIYPKHALESVFRAKGWDGVWEVLRTSPPPLDGPYNLERFSANQEAMLVRNPYFAGSPPAFERVHLVVQADASVTATAQNLREGTLDLVPVASVRTLDLVKDASPVVAKANLSRSLFFLQPDVTRPPFDQLLLRQAVLYAIDRARVARTIFGANGKVADTYRPPTTDDAMLDGKHYGFDPKQAKALLKQAGIHHKVAFKLLVHKYPPDAPIALAVDGIAQDLNAVGFQVEKEEITGSVNELVWKGTHGGLVFSSAEMDVDLTGRFWNVPYRSSGEGYEVNAPNRLFDQEMVTLNSRFRASLFDERRRVLSQQMQRRWAELLPTLPLVYDVAQSVRSTRLVGWDPELKESYWWNVESWYFE